MATATKSKLLEKLAKKPERIKAKLSTMAKVESELGGLPDTYMTEDSSNFDFSLIVKMYWWLVQQEDPDVTEDQVSELVHMGNVVEMIDTINKSYVPDPVPGMLIETEPDSEKSPTKGAKVKNDQKDTT